MSQDDPTQSIHGLPSQLRRGDVLGGRFVVVQFLARGGMGEVYEVADEHLQGKHCALKRLRPEIAADPIIRQRFEREVLLAREVTHPNVCPMYDIFRVDESGGPLLFLTMKLLRGESLAARLTRSEKLDPDLTLTLARQMAAALDAAHKAGVIHRDFKPGNVMLETVDGALQVSITDFGLSRLWESEMTLAQSGGISGTIGYIAPEVLAGHVASPAADVYAFGVVLQVMLTGHKPQESSEHQDELPEKWRSVVAGCLERDPLKRFQSAGEALSTLNPPVSASSPVALKRSMRRWTIAAVLAGAALMVAGAGWLGRNKINEYLHPLPEERFVALMAWPPEVDSPARPLLRTVLESIGNRLVRAEPALKKFTVIAAGAAGQEAPKSLPDAVSSMGANLVMGVSLQAENTGYWLSLKLFDATTGAVLRNRDAQFAAGEVTLLAERASTLAAQILGIPADPSALKDQDEMAKLGPVTYRLFSEAEDLKNQPNDVGLAGAIEKYQRVLEAEQMFALGYADLSLAYSRKFQLTKDRAFLSLAEKNAALALQYNPQSVKGLLAKASVDLYSGNTQRSVDGIAKALQLDPGNPQILVHEARAFADLAQWPQEEAVYREIIRKRPNYWPAYNDLGRTLFRQTRYQAAVDAFAEAAAVAPRVALPLANQGTMFLLLDQDKNAEEAFRRSLERAPNEYAYSNLGSIAFKHSNYQKAIESYSKALDLNPKNFRTWRNLADSYAILGDKKRELESYGKASETLSEALRVNPRPGADWAMLAFFHAKLGQKSEAESDLKTAEGRGLDRRAQFTKAQTLAVLGRHQEALELVLKCVDEGLSPVDVELALDLNQVRADPKYRRHIAAKAATR